jgi:hypothetical protein
MGLMAEEPLHHRHRRADADVGSVCKLDRAAAGYSRAVKWLVSPVTRRILGLRFPLKFVSRTATSAHLGGGTAVSGFGVLAHFVRNQQYLVLFGDRIPEDAPRWADLTLASASLVDS